MVLCSVLLSPQLRLGISLDHIRCGVMLSTMILLGMMFQCGCVMSEQAILPSTRMPT
jgi:hypothetical protein